MQKEKHLQLERLVFFSDAVVAIAITLLALDLKLGNVIKEGRLSFEDVAHVWPKFSAFLLSFLLIAVFWKIHHEFFAYIKQIDSKIFWYNIFWLLFIILLPFSATLVSAYFGQTTSIFLYSVNTLMITIFQNQIWDHAAVRPDYLNEHATASQVYNFRFNCNVAMFNALAATGLSFISPLAAIIVLFARPLMMAMLRPLFKRYRLNNH